jgi:cytochrome c oxidase accessory protein FixG
MLTENDNSGGFRDRLYTIDKSGKRLWVFAKKPRGRLTTARTITGILLMVFFFSAPFIKINGQQLLLFDFVHRTFAIFGVQFWPQDFYLFFIGMITLMVFIILFTVTYGRIWCGWACPQTVFMEVLFRRIEYWIDGDAHHQKVLKEGPWNAGKVFRRVFKHGIFYLISFVISNYFLMYLIGSPSWMKLVSESPAAHVAGLSGMAIFSFIFYFIFSWFREQVCTIVCPYGRLQGVLLDKKTVVISYDYLRGEERGVLRKSEIRSETKKGDCVDCSQCVAVCPTGIDIRNGTQLECINCACCIDACNEMMRKAGFEPGLIRYASEEMIAEKKPWKFTVRSAGYTVVLTLLLIALGYFLVSRNPVEATVLRSPGMLFQEQENGMISNLYSVKVVNKTSHALPLEIRLLSGDGEVKVIGNAPVIDKQSLGEVVFFILMKKNRVSNGKTEVNIGIYSGGKQLDKARATFVGPLN